MIRPAAALMFCGIAMSVAALAGCTASEPPAGEPTFYQNLAQPDVTVDAAAAASMRGRPAASCSHAANWATSRR